MASFAQYVKDKSFLEEKLKLIHNFIERPRDYLEKHVEYDEVNYKYSFYEQVEGENVWVDFNVRNYHMELDVTMGPISFNSKDEDEIKTFVKNMLEGL